MLQIGSFEVDKTDVNFAELQRITGLKTDPVRIRKAAVIGNFPPRQCGLATFTRDTYRALKSALPLAQIDVVAMNDVADGYAYPPEVRFQIAQADRQSHQKLGQQMRAEEYDAVFVQHEFGIYGGPSGLYLLDLLRPLKCPIVTTFHTVLEHPSADQQRVMRALIARSSRLITMAHKGAALLTQTYDVPQSQISVVPHGAPTRPLGETAPFKAGLNVSGRKTISTFGLLSPNKGIETVIKALPKVRAVCPDVVYLVVGATHPHLVRHEGEAYRESLVELARSLGVEHNVEFINRFVNDDELIEILQASDVYVTPYLTESQITSGTLSYALALGRPVISTPYWHAVEALADGVGIICPFQDVGAFSTAISALLSDDRRRLALSQKAYQAASSSRWSSVARAYVDLAEQDIVTSRAGKPIWGPSIRRPMASLEMISRMTDDTGMFQHGRYRLPHRQHGYCTDDVARALSFVARRSKIQADARNIDPLAYVYAAFVNDAWNPQTQKFRNFMSFHRHWLDDGGSDDCCTRALESLADVMRSDLPEDLKLWAAELIRQVLPDAQTWSSLRSRAALARIYGKMIDHAGSLLLFEPEISRQGQVLMQHFIESKPWFEPRLSYDNARLSEGLLWAADITHETGWLEAGLESLTWLCGQQKCDQKGHFRPIPTSRFCDQPGVRETFDQQPIEALATLEACHKAFELTQDGYWRDEANRAYRWFEGANDHGLTLITREGGCHDGLTQEGVNENQGAESILSYHLALCALAEQSL